MENLPKIKGSLRHRRQQDYSYLLGMYAGLAVPLQFQDIEPSEFVAGDSVRVELSTAESILVIVAVITPLLEFTAIWFILCSAPSDTPKLLWISLLF